MRKLLVTLLAAGLCLTGVHAQETENTDGTVTNTDTNEIKTVTADTNRSPHPQHSALIRP